MGNREFVLSPIPKSDVQTMLADAEKTQLLCCCMWKERGDNT